MSPPNERQPAGWLESQATASRAANPVQRVGAIWELTDLDLDYASSRTQVGNEG